MADLTKSGINNQKRGVSVAVIPVTEAELLVAGSTLFNLPSRSVVTRAALLVKTPSGTATSTIDILVGATVVANEVPATAAGMIEGTMVAANQYFATGGAVTAKAGAVTPADGALVAEVIVEYIELDKTTGEYTN